MPSRALAHQMITQMEAQFDTELMDLPHVVMVHDPMVGPMPKTVIGPFPSVIEAMAHAEQVEKNIRANWSGLDPLPTVAVAPLLPPDHLD